MNKVLSITCTRCRQDIRRCECDKLKVAETDIWIRAEYDNNMDIECRPLCDVLNSIPGITTISSCCGHGKDPFTIFFHAREVLDLYWIARQLSHNYGNFCRLGWRLEPMVEDISHEGRCRNNGDVAFLLHSGDVKGPQAYAQADQLADNLKTCLLNRRRREWFGR